MFLPSIDKINEPDNQTVAVIQYFWKLVFTGTATQFDTTLQNKKKIMWLLEYAIYRCGGVLRVENMQVYIVESRHTAF